MKSLLTLIVLSSCIKKESLIESSGFLHKKEILISCSNAMINCEVVGTDMSGTASRIYWGGSYYWLTAAHVCQNFMPDLLPIQTSITIRVAGSNIEENPLILKVDTHNDLCLLSANEGPARRIAKNPPNPGDKVFSIAYPSGIFDPQMLPIYDGRWNGEFKQEGKCMFTIPVSGGSSGAAVLDSMGDVVGVISSVSREFNHMSIGPCHDDLLNFLTINR